MKFLVCKKQEGEGCDYTIGCGMRYDIIYADSIEEVQEMEIWPEGCDECSSLCREDDKLKEILIIPFDEVFKVDIDSIKKYINKENHKKDEQKVRDEEIAELTRLQVKYGIRPY